MSTAKTSVLHSENALGSASQLWGTNPDTFAAINNEFRFQLDAAAQEWSAKCPLWLGPENPDPAYRDALSVSWYAICRNNGVAPTVWINPPYTRRTIDVWMRKCHEEARKGCTIYALVAARIETQWYRRCFASDHLHEERRGMRRERYVHPIKRTTKDAAGYPTVGLVFRPSHRNGDAPSVSYGLSR